MSAAGTGTTPYPPALGIAMNTGVEAAEETLAYLKERREFVPVQKENWVEQSAFMLAYFRFRQ